MRCEVLVIHSRWLRYEIKEQQSWTSLTWWPSSQKHHKNLRFLYLPAAAAEFIDFCPANSIKWNVGKRARRWHSISTSQAQFTTNIYNCQLATKQQPRIKDAGQTKAPPTPTSQSTSTWALTLSIFRELLINCMQFVSIKQQTNFQLVCHRWEPIDTK